MLDCILLYQVLDKIGMDWGLKRYFVDLNYRCKECGTMFEYIGDGACLECTIKNKLENPGNRLILYDITDSLLCNLLVIKKNKNKLFRNSFTHMIGNTEYEFYLISMITTTDTMTPISDENDNQSWPEFCEKDGKPMRFVRYGDEYTDMEMTIEYSKCDGKNYLVNVLAYPQNAENGKIFHRYSSSDIILKRGEKTKLHKWMDWNIILYDIHSVRRSHGTYHKMGDEYDDYTNMDFKSLIKNDEFNKKFDRHMKELGDPIDPKHWK